MLAGYLGFILVTLTFPDVVALATLAVRA